jgi:hypothetical protein
MALWFLPARARAEILRTDQGIGFRMKSDNSMSGGGSGWKLRREYNNSNNVMRRYCRSRTIHFKWTVTNKNSKKAISKPDRERRETRRSSAGGLTPNH